MLKVYALKTNYNSNGTLRTNILNRRSVLQIMDNNYEILYLKMKKIITKHLIIITNDDPPQPNVPILT